MAIKIPSYILRKTFQWGISLIHWHKRGFLNRKGHEDSKIEKGMTDSKGMKTKI